MTRTSREQADWNGPVDDGRCPCGFDRDQCMPYGADCLYGPMPETGPSWTPPPRPAIATGPTVLMLSAIYRNEEPAASVAFEQLAADHGRPFALGLRDLIQARKLIDMNETAIKAIGQQTRDEKKNATNSTT